MLSLDESSRLLDMIAKKFGYDIILLRSRQLVPRSDILFDDYDYTMLGYFNRCAVVKAMLMLDKKCISVKYIDDNGGLKRNDSMYNELVETLYAALENGKTLYDGKRELNAADMPEFMIECRLRGYC